MSTTPTPEYPKRNEDRIWRGIGEAIQAALTAVHREQPDLPFRASHQQRIVVGLLGSHVAAFRGVGELLRHKLTYPAAVVTRSLVFSGVTIAYLDRNRADLVENIARIEWKSLNYELKTLGRILAIDIDEVEVARLRASVVKGQDELRAWSSERGVKLKGLPKEESMASKLKLDSMLLAISNLEHFVHHNRWSVASSLEPTDAGEQMRVLGTANEGANITSFAVEAFGIGAIAAASLLDWPRKSQSELEHSLAKVAEEWSSALERIRGK